MKAIAAILAMFCVAGLHAEPVGATDLVPRADSPAKEKLKIPESEPVTVTIQESPSLSSNYTPPATVPPAKTTDENAIFGDANSSLSDTVDKSKPYAFEILYGEVSIPFEPVTGGSLLIPTPDFFAHAKKISIAVAENDQGKLSDTEVNLVYTIKRVSKSSSSFGLFTILSLPTVEKMALRTQLIMNSNDWNVVAGSTHDSADGTKKYFYWAIRINTELHKFPAGMTDG